jgi:hypothetical protein
MPLYFADEIPKTTAVHAADIRRINTVRYRGADKSLARPERKQSTATEDFDFYVPYL